MQLSALLLQLLKIGSLGSQDSWFSELAQSVRGGWVVFTWPTGYLLIISGCANNLQRDKNSLDVGNAVVNCSKIKSR